MNELIVVLVLIQLAVQGCLIYIILGLAKITIEVIREIRLDLSHLTGITENSLKIRGGHFEAFSPHELMTQAAKVEDCRKRHEERVDDGDSAFALEAAQDLLEAMHLGNHDTDRRPENPYWTRGRVHERAREFSPGGRRWHEHHAHDRTS